MLRFRLISYWALCPSVGNIEIYHIDLYCVVYLICLISEEHHDYVTQEQPYHTTLISAEMSTLKLVSLDTCFCIFCYLNNWSVAIAFDSGMPHCIAGIFLCCPPKSSPYIITARERERVPAWVLYPRESMRTILIITHVIYKISVLLLDW